MRTANFRDDVLWAIAYKLGLTPGVDFLKDQAASLASYINAWVRRLWDGADWPEWTVLGRFSVSVNSRIVGWNAPPIEFTGFPTPGGDEGDAPAPGTPGRPLIGKVLRVYLIDPRTTWMPVDTPFRLYNTGIHCGFEHGGSVWIKYLPRAPEFTSDEWDNDLTYNKDEKVYSPVSGHCFVSKSNNNHGHDPNETGESDEPDSLSVEIMQVFEPGSPGLGGTTEIVEVWAQGDAGAPITGGDATGGEIPDPPTTGQEFTVEVTDEVGTVLGSSAVVADGVKTLDILWSELASLLDAQAGLSAFTISKAIDPLRIRLEANIGFKVNATYTIGMLVLLPLVVHQVQAYVPPTSSKDPVLKKLKLIISEQQVIPNATYQLVFTSLDSKQHRVAYTSLATDDAVQILDGLIKTMIELQGADPFFTGIESTLDASAPSLTFSVASTIAKVSLDALAIPPGSIWWDKVLFPRALVDQVVRGAYADALKEEGQPDKGMPEEQQVPNEQTIRTAAYASKQYDGLTDQVIQRNRYSKQ